MIEHLKDRLRPPRQTMRDGDERAAGWRLRFLYHTLAACFPILALSGTQLLPPFAMTRQPAAMTIAIQAPQPFERRCFLP